MIQYDIPFLNHNPLFISLKETVKHYFSSDEAYDTKSYKYLLYTSLVRMLRAITITKDKHLQLKNLAKIHTWFTNKVRVLKNQAPAAN